MITEEQASMDLARALLALANAVGATGELIYSAHINVTGGGVNIARQSLEEKTAAKSGPDVYDQALRRILGVVQRYLPPDSPITEKEALSEIISIVDPGPWPAGPLPGASTPSETP